MPCTPSLARRVPRTGRAQPIRRLIQAFSFSDKTSFVFGARFRMTASWLDILRSSALSSLAPRASLLRLSTFSSDRATRCWLKALFSMRFSPFSISCISAVALSDVCTVGVILKVLYRIEVRFEESMIGREESTDVGMFTRGREREAVVAVNKRSR